ncbi:synaptogyrin-2a [Neosynchiropus ocellatus]
MQGSAYGASLAGGAFDTESFVKQPQTILRFLSWIFSIVVFATITAEGYINPNTDKELSCMFNGQDSACSYGVAVGVIAFLACVLFIFLDAYLPQISNAKERKYIVTADLGVSGAWTFLWFVCFCVLTHQWNKTENSSSLPGDAARAVIAFSFFSTFSWGLLTYLAYSRYRQGVSDFDLEYRDPAPGPAAPYPPDQFAGAPPSYQQSPFSQNQEQPGEYQPPTY